VPLAFHRRPVYSHGVYRAAEVASFTAMTAGLVAMTAHAF